MNEINLIRQEFNSTVTDINTDINNLENTTTTLQSEIDNLTSFYNAALQGIQNTNQQQDQQISQLQQKDIMATPNQIAITTTTPNAANPYTGITNRYNNGSYISFNGSSRTQFDNKNVAGRKLIIDCYGTPPQAAESSLFEITYLIWTSTNFYKTYCMLHIYPNRLWNNQLLTTDWEVITNEISGNNNYSYTNSTYAPNGRWYWSFNQSYTNYGNSTLKNAYIVPQQGKINVIFGLPQLFNPFTQEWELFDWEVSVRCLDNTTMVENGSMWHLKQDYVEIW